jgi:hypothetical protein
MHFVVHFSQKSKNMVVMGNSSSNKAKVYGIR